MTRNLLVLVLFSILLLGVISSTGVYAQSKSEPNSIVLDGVKNYKSHKFEEALPYFDRALEIDPDNAAAWHYKGLALIKLHRYTDAVVHYQDLLENHPKEVMALNNLGVALSNLDRHTEAIKTFHKVLEIDQYNIAALKGIGISYGNLGEYGDSLYYFEAAQKHGPKDIITANYVEYTNLIIDKYYPKFKTEKPWTTQQVKTKTQAIPGWIKNNAKWWSEDQISVTDFLLGIEYLANQGIIKVPLNEKKESGTSHVPDWIKSNARWWAAGEITDTDFVLAIQFLAENGIIRVQGDSVTADYVVDSAALDRHLSDVSKQVAKEKRYIEFPNPSWFIKKKYLRDTEKWNLDQILDVDVDTFPDPQYTIENGTYVVHYKVAVNEIPFGIPFDYQQTLDKSLEYWSNQQFTYQNQPLVFDFEYVDRTDANVLVAWVVRDFGALGHATLGKGIVEVSMGDYACDGDFQLYDLATIEYIMRHEIGHSLGLEHSTDPSNIMYPTVTQRYGYCITTEP